MSDLITDFLFERFSSNKEADALVWRDETFSYGWLAEALRAWDKRLDSWEVSGGTVVLLKGDFSPEAVALLLALIERGCVVAPLGAHSVPKDDALAAAHGQVCIDMTNPASPSRTLLANSGSHPILERLCGQRKPGLILFTSGSTGESKVVVHDFAALLQKYKTRRHCLRTIAFLLFDHIGGVDTLFYSLSNTSCLITLTDRSPQAVCQAIERHKAEVLPVSPSFINLLLLDESWRRFDLSSLRIVTYGAEVMPEATLKRFHETFPHIRTLQKYGATEIGTLRSQSRASDSVWVRLGGEGYATRVVDGLLEVKADSAMIGYLNAASPFTDDGWFRTGDAVEVDGEFFRILGRDSDIINVGGEKVFPAEVEAALQSIEGVGDAAVYGERHPLLGQIIVARVHLTTAETLSSFRSRMRVHCKGRLSPFKIPQKILLADGPLNGSRLKKMRRAA